MRVGTLAYATEQGLGYLAKAFVDAGVVTDVCVVRHGRRPERSWYPDALTLSNLKDGKAVRLVERMAEACDAMLFFETPFAWELLPFCRAKGIRTALMVMHECTPKVLPQQPDLILCPSQLDLRCFPSGVYVPVPAEKEAAWSRRGKAIRFVHNAGHGGLKGRNGTREVALAIRHIRSEAKLHIRTQDPIPEVEHLCRGRAVYSCGTADRSELYTGDVFLFPEKFNGLSLPLQEAFASGMLVMAGARFPNTEYLPKEPLIPVARYVVDCIAPQYRTYDRADFDPETIAKTVDAWYGKEIGEFSDRGREWAEQNSWSKLKPKYMELLCESSTLQSTIPVATTRKVQ